MKCRKGESEHKAKPGRYRCKQCGAVSKEKGRVCKPQKLMNAPRRDDRVKG